MVTIEQMLKEAIAMNASDIFLVAGHPYAFKINGEIHSMQETRLMPKDTARLIQEIYRYALQNSYEDFLNKKDDDFSFSIPDVGRFRCNVYLQRNSQAAVLRVVRFELPDPVELNIPKVITSLSSVKKGMILVSGPAGCGKSTTLACIIDKINESRNVHIITIEDPIEYLHAHKKSIVSQREVYHDTQDYLNALRSALREAPEVILVGEMRDYETISAAVTAAETGHLVLSTLHTTGAAQTIDRIVDACPAEAKNQVQIQLAGILKGVVTQCLIPSLQGGRIAATEVLTGTDAALNLIRENKCHQMGTVMQSGAAYGMHTLNKDLVRLATEGKISVENAFRYSNNRKELEQMF